MKIELKNVKYSEFASQETNCFEATIYIDGKKQGTADNNGHGGSTSIYPNTLYVALNAYAETLAPTIYEDKQFSFGAGDVIDDLLTDWLYSRDLKRAMQKRILFMRDGIIKETVVLTAERKESIYAHPELLKADKILNLLPFPEALRIYRGASK